MDVNLASHTHHVPQVGFPHNEPVIIDMKVKIIPTGAKLLVSNETTLVLNIKLDLN